MTTNVIFCNYFYELGINVANVRICKFLHYQAQRHPTLGF